MFRFRLTAVLVRFVLFRFASFFLFRFMSHLTAVSITLVPVRLFFCFGFSSDFAVSFRFVSFPPVPRPPCVHYARPRLFQVSLSLSTRVPQRWHHHSVKGGPDSRLRQGHLRALNARPRGVGGDGE